MYYPYLRGKQFELIALRELVEKSLINERIIPIIEPIKVTSTFVSTLKKFVENEKEIAVIINPGEGDIENIYKESSENKALQDLLSSEFVSKAYLMNNNSEEEIRELEKLAFPINELLVIHKNENHLTKYKALFGKYSPKFTFVPDSTLFRRSITNPKVLLEDRFNKLKKNSDYKDRDEFYSADHLFYSAENYTGFSDYSIIGNEYMDGGFAPYAVAIHVVYFNPEQHLWVKSFVSDSNDDIQDPARKFYEAVTYLYKWLPEDQIQTDGLQQLIEHYNKETYPGLGTVKKLSIMHHLELMSQYLEKV